MKNNNETPYISLEILLLNDLRINNTIDDEIFELAIKKISSLDNTPTLEEEL